MSMKKLLIITTLCILSPVHAMIDVDDDLDEVIDAAKKETPTTPKPKKITFPQRKAPSTQEERQKDDILTFFEQTIAPLAEQLGKITLSPETKKAIEAQTKERERQMKEMENKIKSQRSSGRAYSSGSSRYSGDSYRSPGRSSYGSSYSSPYSSSSRGGYSPSSYSPSHSTYNPELEKENATKELSKDKDKDKKEESHADSKKDTPKDNKNKGDKTETLRLRDTFTKTMTDIAKLDPNKSWETYNNKINTQLTSQIKRIMKLYTDYSISCAHLPKEDQIDVAIDVSKLRAFLPHLIYASVADILTPKGAVEENNEICQDLLDTLTKAPGLTKPQADRAFNKASEWIEDTNNPKKIDPTNNDTIQKIVKRPEAKRIPTLAKIAKEAGAEEEANEEGE